MSFPTLTPSGFLADEIALPISGDDALYFGCSYDCSCTYGSNSPDVDYDEMITSTGWKSGQQVTAPFTARWSPFTGSEGESSYNSGCGYSYSCHYGYFSAPNFSVSVSENTYNGDTTVSGSTSHSGSYMWSDSHGSMPVSRIPMEGGRYYSGPSDYYGHVYVSYVSGGSFSSPDRDTGTTIAVPAVIGTSGEPDFDNHTLVSVETYLPPLPAVAATEPVMGGQSTPTISSPSIGKVDVGFFDAFIQEIAPAYVRNADNVQGALDVGGTVPGIGIPADALNGTIHVVRGNKAGVIGSAIGIVPFLGDGYQIGRLGVKATDAIADVAKNHAVQEAFEKGVINVTKIARPQVCTIDATGKVHGDLSFFVPKSWTREQLLEAKEALEHSIKTRKAEQIRLGEDGPHSARIGAEEDLLRQIKKRLSGT